MIILQFLLLPYELLSNFKWKKFGNLNEPRQFHSAVAISKTEILVIGGYNNNKGNLKSCEIIDIEKDTVLPGPEMNFARGYFFTLVTKDTNIFVISGCSNYLTQTVEMFDNKLRKWKYIGELKIARWQHNAEFLNEHEILVVGGRDSYSSVIDDAEIFNIDSGESRIVKPFVYQISDGVSGYTSNNKLVFFGGRSGGTNSYRSKNIYNYDINSDTWQLYDALERAVQIPVMIRLADYRLLMIGGAYSEGPLDFSNYIYLENNGKFSHVGNMLVNRIRFTISQFNKDSVLIISGYGDTFPNTKKCDWFNLTTNITASGPDLNEARNTFCSVTLPSFNNFSNNVILAIGGRDNYNTSISSIEILEPEISSIPPKLTQSSSDCSNYYFTVTDANGINKVELTGINNFNVKISILETLPSTVVHVKVSLIDPNQNGVFNVTSYCYATNKTLDVSGIINRNPSVLKVIAPLDSGKIIVGKTPSGTLKCIKVLIWNTSSQDLVLDYVRLDRNIEFSIPQSQLPLIIPAGDTAELELCYLPSSLDWEYDTLSLKDLCDTLRIPVKAIGDTVFYGGNGNCVIPIKGKTQKPGKSISIGNPYPNPGSEVVSINIIGTIESSVTCYLYDYKGELIINSDVIEKSSWQTDGVDYLEKEYSICLTDVSTGMYFIVVDTIDGKRIFPYFVMK